MSPRERGVQLSSDAQLLKATLFLASPVWLLMLAQGFFDPARSDNPGEMQIIRWFAIACVCWLFAESILGALSSVVHATSQGLRVKRWGKSYEIPWSKVGRLRSLGLAPGFMRTRYFEIVEPGAPRRVYFVPRIGHRKKLAEVRAERIANG